MEDLEALEKNHKPSSQSVNTSITLQQAIEFGEYDPKFLANFSEWHTLSKHIQWELIKKALENRHRQLIAQYAELSNVLDYSKKPRIQEATKNVDKQIKNLMQDKERLYVEYSKP